MSESRVNFVYCDKLLPVLRPVIETRLASHTHDPKNSMVVLQLGFGLSCKTQA
ncbi:hypothetical protein SAMN02745161_1887 [Halodesulfovibrio marinisediminis DSM 17456]|uniref:Uncharacterized protein n=1 Tax=Halodesulfovibrio marinisediminis DSM 17456 TaxID=1121457 RepID=A0A1N6GY67_9BACT|nr:hypothetical protein SAMN02745161_1887 [Halodesulfovibrio marinisediminis DSM 17456]